MVDHAATISTSGGDAISAPDIRHMYCVDTSSNPRIPVLMQLVGSVSRARTPEEIYERFRAGMRRLFPHSAYMSITSRGLAPGKYRISRFEWTDERPVASGGSIDFSRGVERLPTFEGGFVGELIRSAWPELIHNLDVRNDTALGDLLAPFRSMIAVPIFDGGEPLNWAVLLSEESEHFTIEDLEETILRANLIGGMTRKNVIAQELAEAQKRINHELERIASIQRSLLPDPLPTIKGITLASSYVTSQHAGGDYYDFFPLDHAADGTPHAHGKWGVLIADASGHGPSAAVVMAMLHAIVHAVADHAHSPGSILENANRHLCAKKIESSFVTAIYGVYDPKARTFEYARAGHNPPIIKHERTITRLNHVGGFPLGIDPSLKLESYTVQLEPCQTMVFYTDGITEATDAEGHQFGVEGIEQALISCTGEAQCTINSINAALERHQVTDSPADDQTIVAMRINPIAT